jgi:hypothetical protein
MIMLLLGLIVLGYAWLYQGFAQDDAFITYRYARNIAMGHGFVYNLNEPVLGTTTPLYALVLALFTLLSGQEVRLISHLISIFSLWGAGVLLYYLGKECDNLLATATVIIFVTNPLLISAVGMETFFLIFLLLLALQSYLAGKFYLAGIWFSLLILTRYETVIFAGILGLHFLIKRKQLPFWLILSALPVIIWLSFTWTYFGAIISNSAQVKLAEKEGYAFATGAFIWWIVYARQTAWYYALAPLMLLGGYSILRYRKLSTGYTFVLLWAGVYFIAASFAAGSFPWYYGPLIPGLAILLAWGATSVARWLSQVVYQLSSVSGLQGRNGDKKVNLIIPAWPGLPAQTTIQKAVFAVIAGGLILLQGLSATTGWVNYGGQIVDAREVLYREVAAWLNQNANKNQSLAVGEIGVLGYYSNLRIVDLRGLVTPVLLPSLVQGRAETLHQVMELYRPDYLLTDEEVLIKAMRQYPDYSPVQTFRNGIYILYKRRHNNGM